MAHFVILSWHISSVYESFVWEDRSMEPPTRLAVPQASRSAGTDEVFAVLSGKHSLDDLPIRFNMPYLLRCLQIIKD